MYPKFVFKDIDKQEVTASHQPKILEIRRPEFKQQGVTLTNGTQDILLSSFCMLILGKPGSGKSHFISEIIGQSNFYKNKFDRILYIGPTRYADVIHDDYNTSTSLDLKFIERKLQQCNGWAQNMLIIMDDVVSQFPTSLRSRLQELFFNRRHELKKGTISIILTSQKLTTVPTWIRSTINVLVSFAISKSQINTLFNEIPLMENVNEIKNKYTEMTKHQFIYFNLERGKAFDSNFDPI